MGISRAWGGQPAAVEPERLKPIGQAKGIHSGGVVWVHDPKGTDWKGPGDGRWYDPRHTRQDRVDEMMARAVCELRGEAAFRDQAVAYLKAHAQYGWDAKAGRFWGSLKLDGTPVPGPRVTGGYHAYEPRAHIDIWQPYIAGYEHPLATAQAYASAAERTKDAVLLAAAEKWGACIQAAWPPRTAMTDTWYDGYARHWAPHGTHAGNYGRTISFFLHLHALTGRMEHLAFARQVAREAVSRLYYQGLFRGHPAKPYYESADDVGFLLRALLQLDGVLTSPVSGKISCENW